MRKKGISAIVATVLIILITVAGVAIIWVAIVPMIQENVGVVNTNVELTIVSSEGYTVWDEENRIVSVQVKRGDDDSDIVGFDLIFGVGGNSIRHFEENVLDVNSKKVYYVNLSNYFGRLESIKIAPVFSDGKIGEVTGEIRINDIGKGNLVEVIAEYIAGEVAGEIIVEEPNEGFGNCDDDDDCGDGDICENSVCIVDCTLIDEICWNGVDDDCDGLVDWDDEECSGLVSWWEFDGDFNDSIGENHGTWVGTELIINGNFANWGGSGYDTTPDGWVAWRLGGSFSLGNRFWDAGNACHWVVQDGDILRLEQDILVFGKTYDYSLKVQNYVRGELVVRAGGSGGDELERITSNGIYQGTFIHTPDSSPSQWPTFRFGDGNFAAEFEIADVSVREHLDSVNFPVGEELLFNRNYVDITSGINSIDTTQGSMSLWIKFNGNAHSDGITHGIFEIGDGRTNQNRIDIRKRVNNDIEFRYRVGGSNYIAVISDTSDFDNWHHVVGVWNETDISIYNNGVLNQTSPKTGVIATTFTAAFLGQAATPGFGFFFNGSMDDVMLFNRVLNEDEITAIYNNQKGDKI